MDIVSAKLKEDVDDKNINKMGKLEAGERNMMVLSIYCNFYTA